MAIPTVTITGKIYLPDGQVATSGSVTCALSLSGSVDDAGVSHRVGGRRTFTIEADGDIETGAALVPNEAIAPGGTFYRVTFNVLAPVTTVWSEAWQIASAPNPIEIGDIVRLETTGAPTWSASGIPYGIIDAKGDLIVGTQADVAVRLGAGSDGRVLSARAAEATGLIWDIPTRDLSWFRQVGTSPIERWYVANQIGISAPAASASFSTGNLYAIPFISGRGGTIDRVSVNVTTAGQTTQTGEIRLGIYEATSDTNLYPAALIADFGTVNGLTIAIKTLTVSQALNPNRLYWLALTEDCDLLAPTYRGTAIAAQYNLLGIAPTMPSTSPGSVLSAPFTYAALPNPFPAGASVLTGATVPQIAMRFAA